jgi:hypothetical protein
MSFAAELAFRRQAKAILSELCKQAFRSLKTVTSAKLYARSPGITYETFRLVSAEFNLVKRTLVDIVPKTILPKQRPRSLHPVPGRSGTYFLPDFKPFHPQKRKAVHKKRRRETRTPYRPSGNRQSPGHHPFVQHCVRPPLFQPIETGKRVKSETARLTIHDLNILSGAFEFERAGDWQCTQRGTVQGLGIYKVVNKRTILFIEEAELIYSESTPGNSSICLRYKSAKLNSRSVLDLAPGYTAATWNRAATAIDSTTGESCIKVLRNGGVTIDSDLPDEFWCRKQSAGHSCSTSRSAAASTADQTSATPTATGGSCTTRTKCFLGPATSSDEVSCFIRRLGRAPCAHPRVAGKTSQDTVARAATASATTIASLPPPTLSPSVPTITRDGSQLVHEPDIEY